MIHVKICGITRLEDALQAETAGAQAIGFVFAEKSRRFISAEKAAEISKNLKPFTARVGVFVNVQAKEINAIANQVGLTHIQLHGNETPEQARALNRPVIRALHWSNKLEAELEIWKSYPILLDSGNRETPGGTGQVLPWTELAHVMKTRPFILAGGLTAANVEQAIRQCTPIAVDVSSGIESTPGIKDAAKICSFIDNVKSSYKEKE